MMFREGFWTPAVLFALVGFIVLQVGIFTVFHKNFTHRYECPIMGYNGDVPVRICK